MVVAQGKRRGGVRRARRGVADDQFKVGWRWSRPAYTTRGWVPMISVRWRTSASTVNYRGLCMGVGFNHFSFGGFQLLITVICSCKSLPVSKIDVKRLTSNQVQSNCVVPCKRLTVTLPVRAPSNCVVVAQSLARSSPVPTPHRLPYARPCQVQGWSACSLFVGGLLLRRALRRCQHVTLPHTASGSTPGELVLQPIGRVPFLSATSNSRRRAEEGDRLIY